jgi:hypothetical protein
MSNLGEAFAALKNIALLHERVATLRSDIEALDSNVSGLREYAVSIDRRVSRIEGFMEGAAAASGQRSALPKD